MQHFLLSAAARTLSLKAVFRMGEDKAYQTFCQLRWPETEGEAVCPRCGCVESYNIVTRRKFKCVGCHHQFSVTSGTIFASRKLSFTDLLAAIVIFVNGVKGVSALQVSRDLDVQYKTAFVLSHKLREAMALEQSSRTLGGTVEIDGAYFGGYVKQENVKAERKDRRLLPNRSGKRQCVVIMREREGKSLPFVVANEGDAVPYVRDHVGTLATIHADEGSGWDALHAGWDTRRVNHSVQFMDKGVCTNQAESFFSRLRRMEVGTHHHIAGPYLFAYAQEASWREDNRRIDNGCQAMMVAEAAMASQVSRCWKGYWRHYVANAPMRRWLSALMVAGVIVCGALFDASIKSTPHWDGDRAGSRHGAVLQLHRLANQSSSTEICAANRPTDNPYCAIFDLGPLGHGGEDD